MAVPRTLRTMMSNLHLLNQAKQLLESGANLAEVGARLGLSVDELKNLNNQTKARKIKVIPLTPREKEVVIKLAKRGLTRKEIAEMLCISPTQVKTALSQRTEIHPSLTALWELPENFAEKSLFVLIAIGLFPLISCRDLNLFFFKKNPVSTSSIDRHLRYLKSLDLIRSLAIDGEKKYICTAKAINSLAKISCMKRPSDVNHKIFKSIMDRIVKHIMFLLELSR